MERLRRLFLGVPLDDGVRAMLAQHLRQHHVPGRLVPPDNWHLTIRFLGSVDQISMERLIAELDRPTWAAVRDSLVLGPSRPAKAS